MTDKLLERLKNGESPYKLLAEIASALQDAQKEIERLTEEVKYESDRGDNWFEDATYEVGGVPHLYKDRITQLEADLKSVADLAIQHEDRANDAQKEIERLTDVIIDDAQAIGRSAEACMGMMNQRDEAITRAEAAEAKVEELEYKIAIAIKAFEAFNETALKL